MTFTPLPTDIRALLRHLDNHGLLAHVRAACELLAERGVPTPSTLLDELAERIIEDIGRTPGGLDDVALLVAPSDTRSASRPDGADHREGAVQRSEPPRATVVSIGSRIRAHIRAAHAGVPLRLVTSEGV